MMGDGMADGESEVLESCCTLLKVDDAGSLVGISDGYIVCAVGEVEGTVLLGPVPLV
jgi:hypothetical protein